MANKIKLTIQVNDDGSLGIIGKKAKEAAGATDKLDKSTKQLGKSNNATYRTMQGAAHTSSNLSKNFAELRRYIEQQKAIIVYYEEAVKPNPADDTSK